MKVIAYYLPQFHEVAENNLWWGNGFTEWTNVKKGIPLFKNHYQPVEPLNDNYYDLMNKETVEWQTKISKENNIYGFAYYHYWFSGKKILERPAENLLKWKDINQKFFFFWANHDWKRSWNGSSEILIKQEYGKESEWIEHFNYLKQFFIDDRYIKKDNKPVIGIFKSADIIDFNLMIEVWNKMCIEIGFDGIYIIESAFYENKVPAASNRSDAIVIRQPDMALQSISKDNMMIRKIRRALNQIFNIKYLYKPSFDKIVEVSLRNSTNFKADKDVFYGVFTNWDNTTRHKNRGFVIKDSTPDKFKEYLIHIKQISEMTGSEFIFINAWNEWCEGMYLEPDKRFEYGYLEAVKEVFGENNE